MTSVKGTKLRPAIVAIIVEIGMLAGILAALFIVPRNTSLRLFAIVSFAALVLGNVLLVRRLRQRNFDTVDNVGKKRNAVKVYVLTGLLLLLMLCQYLTNRLHIHPFP
jgi:hypothetical protein